MQGTYRIMDLRPCLPFPGPGALWGFQINTTLTKRPVLITHGTFSTADTCAPLARSFAEAGHPTYVIEWRSRGRRPGRFDFHDLAEGEIAQALAHMSRPSHLVAHSGGGLAMILALQDPERRAQVRSLTLLGTQATHLHKAPRKDHLFIRAMGRLGDVLGYWPARVFGLGPSNESAAILSHWLRYNRARKITDRTGIDLFAQMNEWRMPVLALAGKADRVIAPVQGCRALAEAFGPTAQFHLCQKSTDTEDFTHTRLLRSRTAAQHIWPRIVRFIADVDAH